MIIKEYTAIVFPCELLVLRQAFLFIFRCLSESNLMFSDWFLATIKEDPLLLLL